MSGRHRRIFNPLLIAFAISLILHAVLLAIVASNENELLTPVRGGSDVDARKSGCQAHRAGSLRGPNYLRVCGIHRAVHDGSMAADWSVFAAAKTGMS